MRDKNRVENIPRKKKLDHFLEGILPGIYLPPYTMVTFTRMPYSAAARRARVQDWFVYASLAAIAAALVGTMLWLINR